MAKELTYNEQIFRAMVRHQTGLLRFSGHLRNRIWKLLDASEQDMRHQIEDRLRSLEGREVTPARLARVDRILAGLRETRVKAWSKVTDAWFGELRELAVAEPGFTAGIVQSHVGVDLGLALPEPGRLRAIVDSKPFHGATLKQWSDGIAKADVDRIAQQVKIGLTQGESIPQIAKRITGSVRLKGTDGVTQITRNQAAMLTRTATNAIGSEARRALYEENSDIISEELFVATLDARTTPICRSLDGKRFPLNQGATPPMHFGCRSLRMPVIDGKVIGERPVRNFTKQQLLKEFAEKNQIDAPKNRAALPHGTKGAYDDFERARVRELTGTVPATTSYQEWLSGQSAKFQDEILGPTRGRLFRSGGLDLSQFVARNGSELTLAQLAQLEAEAFEAAGIDPKTFRIRR